MSIHQNLAQPGSFGFVEDFFGAKIDADGDCVTGAGVWILSGTGASLALSTGDENRPGGLSLITDAGSGDFCEIAFGQVARFGPATIDAVEMSFQPLSDSDVLIQFGVGANDLAAANSRWCEYSSVVLSPHSKSRDASGSSDVEIYTAPFSDTNHYLWRMSRGPAGALSKTFQLIEGGSGVTAMSPNVPEHTAELLDPSTLVRLKVRLTNLGTGAKSLNIDRIALRGSGLARR